MARNLALGIDLGGTKIYGILTDETHHIIADAKRDTEYGASPETVAGHIADLGNELMASAGLTLADAAHVGIAVPAPVDPVTGESPLATNLGWKNFSLQTEFNNLFGKKVYIGNDGNLGVLAEYTCGAAQGFKTILGCYVGTGLGGGIIVNGKLLTGNHGMAAEFGHSVVKQGGHRCGCGRRGCVEAYCSKIAFVKALRKKVFKQGVRTTLASDKFNAKSRNIKSKHLAKAYQAGDQAVCEVINRGAYMLGVAAASASALIAPDCIILGGGVIDAMGKEMLPAFNRGFADHLFGLRADQIQIRFTSLGDAAVALGATVLARKKGNV